MSSRWRILAVLCLAVFVVNVSTTIVNIALPTLTREVGADTRDLLWIVDSFNLTFAAFVLAAGSLSDRFGRRRFLVGGLGIVVVACLAGSQATSSGPLIASRAVAGIGAAIVFPVTLSIISNVFSDRKERAQAIGLWGASTGMAVALGPVAGGWLLEQFWWGSILVFTAVVAGLALALSLRIVPDSRDPSAPQLDIRGLVLSAAALGLLVHTIIEAPERGWASAATLAAFAATAALLAVFVRVELRTPEPMLDVRLFTNLRFTAASLAVTTSFFALFGFIFLITQYFQFVRGYGPLETGLRILPVATFVAITSVLGALLAVRFGTKLVVAAGLLSLSAAYSWVSTAGTDTSYWAIVGQMVLLGSGMGLTSTPATEAIMGVVPAAKAGIGSAVNDATRELGGTLGVAIIGSVSLSLYRDAIGTAGLPAEATETARESVGAAYGVAATLPGDGAAELTRLAQQGFLDGLSAGCLVAAGVTFVGALLVLRYLPAHPLAVSEASPVEEAPPAAGLAATL
ncbi:MAG: MFS transporter [Solirubrobacterales bacterium]|nr:MFS transporter [Solirubrobacterales bacterium]